MKLNKVFKWGMVALILVSVALLVLGFVKGFEANDAANVQLLLSWTYVMLGLAIFCWVVLGFIMSVANDPKSLIKFGVVLVGIAALVAVAYVLASGAPAMGILTQPSAGTLKLTDTILNLIAIVGAASILAIVVGEVRMAIANAKK